MIFRGALQGADGSPLALHATDRDTGERVEVELVVGHKNVIYAQPREDAAAQAPEADLPDLTPVVPEARTTPFDVNDFAPPGAERDERGHLVRER